MMFSFEDVRRASAYLDERAQKFGERALELTPPDRAVGCGNCQSPTLRAEKRTLALAGDAANGTAAWHPGASAEAVRVKRKTGIERLGDFRRRVLVAVECPPFSPSAGLSLDDAKRISAGVISLVCGPIARIICISMTAFSASMKRP